MKRLHMIILGCIACMLSANGQGKLFVSPAGYDAAAGTESQPFATLQQALRKARDLRRLKDVGAGIHIILKGGLYPLRQTIHIRAEDGGTDQSPTIIEAAPGAKPILSGGVNIQNWRQLQAPVKNLPATAKGKIWVADVPLVEGNKFVFRQLWINNKKAVRAQTITQRILNWNHHNGTCWIPAFKGIDISATPGLEMFIQQWWEIAILRIKKAEVHGDSILLAFQEPESKIQNEHPWPAPWLSKETGNSAFHLTNDIRFLDTPGEWYLDADNRKLYYWPQPGENMQTAEAIASSLETLIDIAGSDAKPVSHIQFKGISFEHTGWLRPSVSGHVPHQLGMYMLEAYKLKPQGTPENPGLDNQAWVGKQAAAVNVVNAEQIDFEQCSFTHLAATGLEYGKATYRSRINGNLFKDIGGNGVQLGYFSDEHSEIHIPYHPGDEKEVCSNIEVSNNLITDISTEDWGCAGIAAGYVRNASIHHNDISETNYTGISIGWGWTSKQNASANNHLFANKIRRYAKQLYDAAAIYTQSAQPGTVIENNDIDSIYKAPYAHLPSHWFYLYTDEGSSFITIKNNWTPAPKFLQNASGPGNVWENNGPQVSTTVRADAGLQTNYQWLLREKSAPDIHYAINKAHPVILEMILPASQELDAEKLKTVLAKSRVSEDAVYRWKQHVIIFDQVQDVYTLQQRLRSAFAGAEVKMYEDMFYEFNRQQCVDTATAPKWQHIIFTADLVGDPVMQQQYLQYHATQREKWPEVANGFCNASFQQLLLFRNGRQLMLVISIPEKETLDTLNPKTTENNPRVNEWNAIMKKYQQGIPGTAKGEVWVKFEKVFTP